MIWFLLGVAVALYLAGSVVAWSLYPDSLLFRPGVWLVQKFDDIWERVWSR